MKKLLTILFAAFLLIGVAACNGERTYTVDGEYTAFEIDSDSPTLTSVTVTIENDEITGYYIDVLQSNRSTFAWNEETKKELGYGYRMHGQRDLSEADYITWLEDNEKLEWFEQAELIEQYWMENGVDSVTTDTEGTIDNVAGVTVSDSSYTVLAAEAVQQAKDGVIKAYAVSSSGDPQVTWVEVDLDANGDVEDIFIDVLQSDVTQTAGEDTDEDASDDEFSFAWDEKTKQEKGFEYKMHYRTYSATDDTPTLAEYETWLTDNDKLEWFQQADMISDYIVENGWEDSFAVEGVDELSAVSVTTSEYEAVLQEAFDLIA
ncbi:MAG: hypothetical protein PF513_08010 [Tenericutes bacterium]|jgi:major membrane immunogen (membrane-anchored lipoprotein)|nr:hypothetical protein [Mycoplasmatota bacterium]